MVYPTVACKRRETVCVAVEYVEQMSVLIQIQEEAVHGENI